MIMCTYGRKLSTAQNEYISVFIISPFTNMGNSDNQKLGDSPALG